MTLAKLLSTWNTAQAPSATRLTAGLFEILTLLNIRQIALIQILQSPKTLIIINLPSCSACIPTRVAGLALTSVRGRDNHVKKIRVAKDAFKVALVTETMAIL